MTIRELSTRMAICTQIQLEGPPRKGDGSNDTYAHELTTWRTYNCT